MQPDRWQRITELFEKLEQIEDHLQREHELDRLCPDDADLRGEVLELLRASEQHADFLEQPIQSEAEALIHEHFQHRWTGRRLGAWTIESLISEGGMGAVFKVNRHTGDYQQSAALKVIKAGFESRHLVERFTRERELLARLAHPGIARLIDGGTTEEGLPWLVMELVEGLPIDQWCDRHCLDIEARLALFTQVCQAVQFAHQNLVIHRDLKSSNILVTTDGQIKLLDFGIAKLISDNQIEQQQTVTQQRLLTLSAASPEQFLGQPITTASDVYALGLLLYLLLTGKPAYRTDGDTSASEIQRWIVTDLPTRPSLALARQDDPEASATARATRPGKLRSQLSGDLDTIVMKALRKEPQRRYSSAEALARDIERFQNGHPVQARPDSLTYRSRKFAVRHWKGLMATTLAFAALCAGLGIALWQADQARSERDRTLLVNQFLQTILIEADPYEAGADATIRDVLRKASAMVGERFADQPDLEAPLRHTIGHTQLSLMDLDDSRSNLARADQLNRDLYGPDDERTLRTQAYLAWIEFRRGDYAAADAGYQAVIARLGDHHDREFRATVLNDYGVVLGEQERYGEAIELYESVLALQLEHSPQSAEVGITYNNLGYAWHGLNELETARDWYMKGLEIQRAKSADGADPNLAYNLNNIGVLLRDMGELEQALPYYEESLAIRLATLGNDHAFTGLGHLNLGRLLLDMDRVEQARPHLRSALHISESTLESDQLQLLVARASQARINALDGDHQTAQRELSEVLATMNESTTPSSIHQQVSDWLMDSQVAQGGQTTEQYR
jgi:eukaryotic-like serine/threonine-protein kinase